MHILLANDDGYQAQGIQTLYAYLKNHGHRVTMVAPHGERSAQSHAMTFYQAIQVRRLAEDIFAVHGTPADCVAIGIQCLLKNDLPDVVVSGINHGFNVGIDVNYSGTVGAATEGALLGYRALAVSMDTNGDRTQELAAGFLKTAELVGEVLDKLGDWHLPKSHVLNINTPMPFRGIAAAQCSRETLYYPHIEELPSKGQPDLSVYLIGGLVRTKKVEDPHQDVALVAQGYATLSVISAKQSSTGPHTTALSKLVDDLQKPLWH